MTKAPDRIISENLQDIATELSNRLEKLTGQPMAFSLCVFNIEDNSRMNYVSNCKREEVINVWQTLLESWGEGMPDIPGHKVQ